MKKILIITLILTFLFASNISPNTTTPQNKFIFFGIGVNYQAKGNDDYAPDIVSINNELLKRTINSTYKNYLILGKTATYKTIMEGFQWLTQNSTSSDTILIYIAAHGSDSSEYYFQSADYKIWVSEMRKYLEILTCRVIIIVDTCHSGAFVRDCDKLDQQHFFIIASCKAEESSWGWHFFDSLMEAFSKLGDFNKDGIISTTEIIKFIPPNLANRTKLQHMVKSKGSLDIPLVKV